MAYEEDHLVLPPVAPAEAYERYPGKWVGVRNGEVVAVADTLDELWADKERMRTFSACRIPEPDEIFF